MRSFEIYNILKEKTFDMTIIINAILEAEIILIAFIKVYNYSTVQKDRINIADKL